MQASRDFNYLSREKRPSDVWPFVVPPTTAKRLSQRLLVLEEEALLEADEVFIIGWSLPETDRDQECLIRNAARKRRDPFKKIVAVNLGAGSSYYVRVANIFGVEPQELEIHNTGFPNVVRQAQ